MVDKNGKLFGKINLIDLLVILIVIAVVVLAAMKVVNAKKASASLSEVKMSFFAEEIPDYVAQVIQNGTSVMDSTGNVTMGTVDSFKIDAPLGYVTDPKGQAQEIQREGYKSVTLNITAKGVLSDHGIKIDGTLYSVGHTLTLYAGEAKMYMKVSAITPAA